MDTHTMKRKILHVRDCDRKWWMTLTRRQIDELEPFEWRAYRDGECICGARTKKECACGARFKEEKR